MSSRFVRICLLLLHQSALARNYAFQKPGSLGTPGQFRSETTVVHITRESKLTPVKDTKADTEMRSLAPKISPREVDTLRLVAVACPVHFQTREKEHPWGIGFGSVFPK